MDLMGMFADTVLLVDLIGSKYDSTEETTPDVSACAAPRPSAWRSCTATRAATTTARKTSVALTAIVDVRAPGGCYIRWCVLRWYA